MPTSPLVISHSSGAAPVKVIEGMRTSYSKRIYEIPIEEGSFWFILGVVIAVILLHFRVEAVAL